MKSLKQFNVILVLFVLFLIFIGISFLTEFQSGIIIGRNFWNFSLQMIKILPPIFILIGLFDVWVKREIIIKHLGSKGGFKSYFWVFLLAAPMAGGILPSFPIAYSLYKKGARLTIVLTFLGAVGIGRIPMILFESTFLGWNFSVIRIIVSIPLVIVASLVFGKSLEKNGYKLPEKDKKL